MSVRPPVTRNCSARRLIHPVADDRHRPAAAPRLQAAAAEEVLPVQRGGDGAASEGYRKLSGYVQQLYDSRVGKPGDDIPSFLLELRVGGENISRTQRVGLVMMLIMAGLDTTANGAALILHFLGTRPDIREQLPANQDSLPDAVEELREQEIDR
jgi:cytochrome P450